MNQTGGGEILEYIGQNPDTMKSMYLNGKLVWVYKLLPLFKYIAVIMILLVMVLALMKLFNIKSLRKGKGLIYELDHIDKMKRRDNLVLNVRTLLDKITFIIEKSPLRLSPMREEYLQYNLNRANWMVMKELKVIKAKQYNALICFTTLMLCLLGVVIAVVGSFFTAIVWIIIVIMFATLLPNFILREVVKANDAEVKKHFAEMYFMLHYTLVSEEGVPLHRILQSYAKTINSAEMLRFVGESVLLMESYSLDIATTKIASAYREIPQVVKLMRLIKQGETDKSDTTSELNGFREEVLQDCKYAVEIRGRKLIAQARISMWIMMALLGQALMTWLAIYLRDISGVGTLFG